MKYKLITIISITIFSAMLWVFVSFAGDYSTTLKIPIKFEGVPEGYSINQLSAKEVTINVKGQGWQLAQLTFGVTNSLTINIEDKKQNVINVRKAIEQNSWATSNLQVNLVEPENISYTLEKINYKTVRINPIILLDFKPGYGRVSEIKLNPDTLLISGPRSLIKNIDFVNTQELYLEDLEKNVSVELLLAKLDNTYFSTEKISVEFEVQKIVDKTFENIPVVRKGVPSSRELFLYPEKVNVILRGGIKMLGTLEASQIKLSIDYSQALEDTVGTIEPSIQIPEYTTIIDIRPKRLDYIIKQY
ncbi:MAG: hypothetical protein CVV23_14290 [Ignavibacteriae bacterium HGW-Ignavibacteriae-2]|jgi:hypothetical protein|nr:hypothetical protein [Bacteroidota bacterium]PKL87666.1 MAG: hypothetical protein CVV23_14290 [Ignavibacteriae bacterium HGW-Ignavibacteriae-2]